MSLRHALLGLLREQPASGYDLLRIFNHSLHNVWPATQSQIYPELGKLAGEGLLTVSARGARGRKVYTLTDAGLGELRRWLRETEPELHPRSDALLRVFLLGALTRGQAGEYLAWLAQRATEDHAALGALEAVIDWDDNDDLTAYGRLVMEYGKRLTAMNRDWAQWAAARVTGS
jgi:PadR family transcriptional regulator AphA